MFLFLDENVKENHHIWIQLCQRLTVPTQFNSYKYFICMTKMFGLTDKTARDSDMYLYSSTFNPMGKTPLLSGALNYFNVFISR